MKVLLVNPPPYKIQEAYYDTPPYPRTALGFLAAHLKRHGVQVDVLDCKFDRLGYDEGMEKVLKFQPDIVGFTAFTNEIVQAAHFAALIKKKNSNIITLIGGVHVSELPERTLREFSDFDFGVVGEGEMTLLELVNSLENKEDRQTIPGVCFINKNGEYVYGGVRTKIQNSDVELAPPDWSLFRPAKEYILHTSRGCPFHCPFCINPNGRKVRAFSADKVLDELEDLTNKYGNVRVLFGDEIFTIKRDRTIAICKGMIERGLHKKIKWWCITHVRFMDKELAKLMKEAGCFKIGLGIETGDEQRLKEISKGTTLEMIDKVVKELKSVRMVFEAFFILGQPNETYKSAQALIDFAVKLNPTLPVFGIMVPYPGTKIWEMAKAGEGGYKLQNENWNAYNKQIGDALTFEHVSRSRLEWFQIWGYVKVYLWNFRLIDLIKYGWQYRIVALSIVFKLTQNFIRQSLLGFRVVTSRTLSLLNMADLESKNKIEAV